jgi:DNA-directed RNA polymerase subunit RPC12/RpoP
MLYKCANCEKEFDHINHYRNHLRRKIPCINKKVKLEDLQYQDNKSVSEQDNNITDNNNGIDDNKCCKNDNINVSKRFQAFPNVSNDEIIYECSICHKKYNTRSGLFKHKKVHPIFIEEGNLTDIEQPNISVNDINNINELNTDINNKINVNDDLRDQEVIDEKIIQGEWLKNVSSIYNKCCKNDNINVSKRFQAFPSVSNENIIYECSICHKKYNSRSGLFKHEKAHSIFIEEGKLGQNVQLKMVNINTKNINELNTDLNNKVDNIKDHNDLKVINEKIIHDEQLKNVSSNDNRNVSKCFHYNKIVSKCFQNDNVNDTVYKCLLCNKTCNDRSNFWKHKKSHSNYIEEVEKLVNAEKQNTDIFIKLDEVIKNTEEQKEIITGLTSKKKIINDNSSNYHKCENVNNPINNGTVNNNDKCPINNGTVNNNDKCPINNGTINNYIVQFGKEDTSKLNQNEVNNILCSGRKNPLLMAIEYLHFNKRLPEQQNIRCTNIHSKYIDIYDGKDWIKELSSKIVDELYLKRSSDIEQLYNSCDGNVKSRITSAVKRVIETFNVYDEYDSEEKQDKHNKKLMSFVDSKKEDIKLLLHNKTKTSDI